MSRLVQDEDPNYLLVKRNGEVIAKYPITEINLLKEKFKDICSSSEYSDYASLDDFVESIYFLEFLEYFLYYLHSLAPDVIPYKKNASKMTKDELFIMSVGAFRKLIGFAYSYLYDIGDLRILFNKVNYECKRIIKTEKTFSKNEKQLLIRMYHGFLCFLNLLIENGKIDDAMSLFVTLKNSNLEGKLIKTHSTFNQSILLIINKFFTNENMIELRKNLLSKFRLFQRKYLSAIAKLRKIGPPNALPEKSREIKKELNKNKDIDYKAYEVFCLYVLSKEENEAIYDYLAGIHKNTLNRVIHKNINNNKVANIKANTKMTHHKEYIEKSKEILENVEDKIKEHGDIIDSKTKSQVERIRKLFDSEQFKNSSLSFGNENSPSIGGKIIQDCKTIQIINKEIDKIIKQEKQRKQEQEKEKQEKEKQEKEKQEKEEKKQDKKTRRTQKKHNYISKLANNNSNINQENNIKQKTNKLLSKYTNKLKNKTLTDLKRKEILEIIQRLEAYKNNATL
jgi:hypothetical protein